MIRYIACIFIGVGAGIAFDVPVAIGISTIGIVFANLLVDIEEAISRAAAKGDTEGPA